jgi:hypothetical protein
MADQRERQVDQFIEGSLTPVQARELAQAALERPELFEELTYQAVANAGLPERAAREHVGREKLRSLPQGGADLMGLYVSGKLSRSAERQLAQAALDDEALFDALVTHGAVEKSLRDPAFRAALSSPVEARAKVLRFPHKTRAIAIGSIAAALTVIGIYSWKSLSSGRNQPSQANDDTAVRVPAPAPSLDFAAGRPILLAADLRPDSVKNGATPVFRGADTESRPPQPSGTVLSIDDRQATISLGSLDGLTKGTELQIFRGANLGQPIARLLVTTVFRDRARGLVAGGQSIRENDRVSAPPAVYLAAVLEETNRLADSGESPKARSLARAALAWADSAAAPLAAERKIFERLGPLDFQAGDAAAAENDYRSAVASFDAPPSESAAEQAATLNALGVLYLLRSDYAQAEAQLGHARVNQARANVADGTVYARTLNNLAVLAELRGDAPKAAALYRDALRALGNAVDTSEDRKAVDANLARLGNVADGKR